MDTLQTTEITQLVKNGIEKSMPYQDYRTLVADLSDQNKSTGETQNDAFANYTTLNNKRMKRLDKTIKLSENDIEKIKKVDKKITWLVLTESWCGDAAQTMPIMNTIASYSNNIEFRVVLRDENIELMNHFLYNGTLSIPKLLMIDKKTNTVISEWGPRPNIASKMVEDYKNEHGGLSPEFKQDLQVWYTKDKGRNTIDDLLSSLLLK